MPDLPKQELDELFREGAGMQQFEYNEAAWDKMEGMLDNDDKNRKIGIWLLLLVGVAMAFLGGLYYTSLEDTNIPTKGIYANENVHSNSSSEENQVAQIEVQDQKITEEVENEIISSKETADIANDSALESTNFEVKATTNRKTTQTGFASNTVVHTTTNSATTYNSKSNKPITNLSNEIVNITIPSSSVNNQSNTVNEFISNELIDIAALKNRKLSILTSPDQWLVNNQSRVNVNAAEYDAKDNGPSISSRLSYSLFAAPEWSSLGANGPRKMGYKFGAKIGFQLNDKFELSTGLSISQKKFNGSGSQFTLTEGWVDNVMPMTMKAKCNVIEIPLDINYHFSGVGNTGFVAGLGLRSFMLHSEWYGFEYAQWKPGLKDEIVTDNTQNKNWVGSIELSLGYTKKVSNNLSLQIVPYLQIPITGIGEGKVDLFSGGVQFAVRFDGR